MKRKRWTMIAVFAMVAALLPLSAVPAAGAVSGSSLIITGVIDGPLAGGTPKAVEFYAVSDVDDLSIYGFGSANNGGGSDGEEFTFPGGSVSAGKFIYVATEAPQFTAFFGFVPDYTSNAASINGDDAIELFMNGSIVDVFGDINTDGTGQPWEYKDGWAYRVDGTGPDGSTFVLGNWDFSGPNALDGETSNATAATPFPTGSYTPAGANAPVIVSCSDIVTDEGVASTSAVEASDADGIVQTLELVVDPIPASGYISLDAIVPATAVGEAATAQVSVDTAVPAGSYNVTVSGTNTDTSAQTGSCNLVVTVNTAGTISIYDIQYTTDASGDSPYAGQTVATEGVVTAVFGNNAFIQDGAGPWSGLFLYGPSIVPSIGDTVRVQGKVSEYYGKTEISDGNLTVTGNGTLPAPEVLATGDIAKEQWESVFVRAENATVANPDLGYGEWSVDDGTGPVRIDDLGSYGYTPNAGDPVTFVQGPLDYSYGNFKIEPRDDGDLFVDLGACGLPYTPIYDIQGSGDASPIEGSTVWTEGVVTADFQESSELNGFFLQDATGDGDTTTSDGIFVYQKVAWGDVEVGQHLRFQAKVSEYHGLTELGYVSDLTVCGTGSVAATVMPMPLADREPYEGMLLTFPDTMTVADTYNLHVYGEAILSSDGPLYVPTNFNAPDPMWFDDPADSDGVAEVLEPRLLVLDDGSGAKYPDPVPYIQPYGTLRWGDTTTNLTGVLTYTYDAFKLEPIEPVSFAAENPRPASTPSVGGFARVASFNLHNWWTTFGERGARDQVQFDRQKAKLVAAITGLNVDIVGLEELENNGDVAIGALVDALNNAEGAGTWAYIADPPYAVGDVTSIQETNAIKVGIIYKPAAVSPIGDAQWGLDAIFSSIRPPLAQTFEVNGEEFTLVVNHFKSKGYYGDPIDPADEDQDDGQGYYNNTRVLEAEAVLDFVEALQTSTGDPDVLVVGDLNVYPMEDPVATLSSGLVDLTAGMASNDKYSFVYYGQGGQLDYAFASDSLAAQITGTSFWHIDAAEPRGLNYYGASTLYQANAYRASDHDPVIVGLQLDTVAPVVEATFQRLRGRMFMGLYRVRYSCEDAIDPNPSCEGVINESIPVADGQLVSLIRAPGRSWHKVRGSVLIIKAPSFELVVTGTDAAGNTATATAEPKFRRRHHHRH